MTVPDNHTPPQNADLERVIAVSLARRYGWRPCADSSTPIVVVDARRVVQALIDAGYEVTHQLGSGDRGESNDG